MGNKIASPVFSYEAVCSSVSAEELSVLKSKFKDLCGNDRAGGAGLLDMGRFIDKVREGTCSHLITGFLPRLFCLMAGGRDAQTLKFEEYMGALALFRTGSKEDKLKCKIATAFIIILYI